MSMGGEEGRGWRVDVLAIAKKVGIAFFMILSSIFFVLFCLWRELYLLNLLRNTVEIFLEEWQGKI